MAKYLEKYGKVTLDNGYAICFIRPGEKRPFGKEWEETLHGPKRIAAAIRKGRGGFGVGIKTKGTPGVDIDCYDRDIVDHMREFTIELLGETIERVGQPPKTLLVYRAEKPFRKVQSTRYEDDEGRSVKLEVLGDGQQFVAFHVHPDTGEPYRWKDKRAPHNVSADELPTITEKQAQQIADEFDRIARALLLPDQAPASDLAAWVQGEFALFDLADAEAARNLGLRLAERLRGQPYSAYTDHPSCPYRCDNRLLWEFEELEFDTEFAPPPQVRKYVSVSEMVNEVEVETAGEEIDGHAADILAELGGIVGRRHRVIVRDEVITVALALRIDGWFDRAKVISHVKTSAWLQAGQNSHTRDLCLFGGKRKSKRARSNQSVTLFDCC